LKTKLIAFIAVLVAAAAVVAAPGLASSRDHNGDQIPDKWEKKFHLSTKVDQSNRDQDNDGVDNLCEFQSHSNPRSTDSNNDGQVDSQEADDAQCEANDVNDDATDDNGGDNQGGHGADDGPNHT
jgi:predicted transposase YbfD/YdcC